MHITFENFMRQRPPGCIKGHTHSHLQTVVALLLVLPTSGFRVGLALPLAVRIGHVEKNNATGQSK